MVDVVGACAFCSWLYFIDDCCYLMSMLCIYGCDWWYEPCMEIDSNFWCGAIKWINLGNVLHYLLC